MDRQLVGSDQVKPKIGEVELASKLLSHFTQVRNHIVWNELVCSAQLAMAVPVAVVRDVVRASLGPPCSLLLLVVVGTCQN